MIENSTAVPPDRGWSSVCFLDGIPRNRSTAFQAIAISTSAIIAVLSPVAAIGNSLVLVAVWKNASLRSPSYVFLCRLAFADLFTGLVTQPLYVTLKIMCLENGTENRSFLLANFTFVLAFCGSYFIHLSLTLVTLISVERRLYMARRSLLTVPRTWVITAVGALLLIPVPLIKLMGPTLLYTVIFFVLMLFYILATSTSYFKVFLIIRRHQQQVEANQSSQNFSQSVIDVLKYKKSIFTILYILGVFYVSYSPFLILAGVYIFLTVDSEAEVGKMISMLFLCLSSSLNPAIYIWRMNDIRIGVRNLLKKPCCM